MKNATLLSYGMKTSYRTLVRLVLASVALIAISAYLLRPVFARHLADWRNARLVTQCQEYLLSPDTVVYTTENNVANALCATGQYARIAAGLPDAARIVPPWRELSRKLALPGEGHALFCHLRRAPGGHVRIVVVTSILSGTPLVHLIDPGSLSIAPRVTRSTSDSIKPWPAYPVLDRADQMSLTFRAGQPDAADASHFMIPYATPEGAGSVDGWLLDDDRVRFRVLSGPCKLSVAEFEDMERAADELEHGDVQLPAPRAPTGVR
jgi:hypothetical protein